MRPVHPQTAVASPKQTLLHVWTGMGEDGKRADTKRRTGVRDAGERVRAAVASGRLPE